MQALSISFGVGLDNKGRLIRSITLEVVAELDPADASQETLSGRLLYLLPFQLREIKESGNAIVSFKGQEYWFVRLERNGVFTLQQVRGPTHRLSFTP